jgi:hypothetical protein
MKVSAFWLVVGIITGVILLSALAVAKSRQSVYDQLQGYTFVQDGAHRQALEDLAAQVADREIAKEWPDRRLLSVAVAVLRQTAREKEYRDRVEAVAGSFLLQESSRRQPRSQRLRVAYELLGLVDSTRIDEDAQRIVAVATYPAVRVQELRDSAERLRDDPGSVAGDALLGRMATLYSASIRPAWQEWSWLANKANVLEDAVREAREAGARHFESLVGELPAWSSDRIAAEPNALNRLRRAYGAVRDLDAVSIVEPAARSRYAAAVRREALPGSAWAIVLVAALVLFGGLSFAIRRVLQGPEPIDPSAETLENVEPIDLDTDAVTMDATTGQRKIGTGSGTGTGSDTVA